MAGNNAFNSTNKDSMDINELASLNDDISPELIEQLQQKLTQNAQTLDEAAVQEKPNTKPDFNSNDDTTLFEEPSDNKLSGQKADENSGIEIEAKSELKSGEAASVSEQAPAAKKSFNIDKNFDDNFIKKYKAKLNKQKEAGSRSKKEETEKTISSSAFADTGENSEQENIEQISKGNISEHAITKEQKNYNDSLDFLDGNIKYSKYVIYNDPQNVPFIDSLTVKERKNLINKILREQDDIAITKQRFKIINSIIRHAIVAVLTITISIPVIYWTINASLEATVNNYRHSQTIFKTLYKENGKININR